MEAHQFPNYPKSIDCRVAAFGFDSYRIGSFLDAGFCKFLRFNDYLGLKKKKKLKNKALEGS